MMTRRIAIAQIAMHWTTRENIESIARALKLAHGQGASICAFPELAVTGFHRQIAREALPDVVGPAIGQLQDDCAGLSMAAAVGAPTDQLAQCAEPTGRQRRRRRKHGRSARRPCPLPSAAAGFGRGRVHARRIELRMARAMRHAQ
jgi:predicted amidohydrolase